MKHVIYIIAILLPWACVPDNGNYAYADLDELSPAKVTGINAEYTLQMMDTLRLSPTIEANDDNHDYLWFIYSTTMERDTIGHQRELQYIVTLPPALNYRLALQVTNRQSGLYKFHYATLKVITPFAEGYYVTKDRDRVTDLDFIFPDGKIAPDILAAANGEGVPGEAVTFANAKNISVIVTLEDGRDTTYKNHHCFYVMTRSTVQIYDAQDARLMNKIDKLFMKLPDNYAPHDIICVDGAKVITNDSLSYVLDTRASAENIGRWGVATPGSRLDPVNICRSSVGGFLVFDPDSRSLKQLNTFKGAYTNVIGGALASYNMVFMKEKAQITAGGVALLRHRDTRALHGLTIKGLSAAGLWESPVTPMVTNPVATNVAVPAASKLHDATLYGTHASMDALYFSAGDNELWYYNLVNSDEQNVITLPPDERIVYAQTLMRYISGATLSNLAVLTSVGAGWTLRVYDFQPSSPLVVSAPILTVSGNGSPRQVFYRSLTSNTSF
ncbi:MAG: hypothetical protein LBG30_01750 [Odoribacteraceae bacterium]|jgi:hypothetical protein|nr:hypothetical protein [Odoribacteraceae bacterium]